VIRFRSLSAASAVIATACATGAGAGDPDRRPVAAPPAPVRTAPFVWGVNGHPARPSEAYDWSEADDRLQRQMRLVGELGFSHYRVDTGVGMDGAEGGRLAAVADAADRFGITLLPVLTFSPAAVPAAPADAYRAGRAIGDRFVRNHGARFPVVEIGNELDLAAMVAGQPVGHRDDHYRVADVDRFAALLRGAIEGLRAGAPGVRPIVNFAGSHTGFVRMLLERGVPLDIVGWHLYVDEAGYGDDPPNRADYRATLARLDTLGREVWITEVNRYRGSGPGNAHPAAQAAVLDRLAEEMHARPLIGAFVVYQLFDEAAVLDNHDEDEAWYGLVHCAGPLPVARRCGGALEIKHWRARRSTVALR
jgi:hypothetical protein